MLSVFLILKDVRILKVVHDKGWMISKDITVRVLDGFHSVAIPVKTRDLHRTAELIVAP